MVIIVLTIRFYIIIVQYIIVQQRIRAIKLSSVIILLVGACWGQIDEVPSHISIFETWFAATGVCISQPQQHSKPGMMNNWRHNWTKLFNTLVKLLYLFLADLVHG